MKIYMLVHFAIKDNRSHFTLGLIKAINKYEAIGKALDYNKNRVYSIKNGYSHHESVVEDLATLYKRLTGKELK